jgi:hypothetical protein
MQINGKEVCRSEAEYGGEDATLAIAGQSEEWKTIRHMTECEGPIPVKKGDKITLEARYDMEEHPA